MFAHHDAKLPETLLPDDVADLLARLGYRVDRRNLCRALEAADIPGVVPPASRAARWTIPVGCVLDVVAAVLQRRDLRAAAPGRRPARPLDRYHLPAARLLMQVPALAEHVLLALRRRVSAEVRERVEAARERARERQAAAERARRAEARVRDTDIERLEDYAMQELDFEA